MYLHLLLKMQGEGQMPTYIVSAVSGRFSDRVKQKIAAGITQSHSKATGAPGFFAQVIFSDIPKGNHFIGGRPLDSDQIFVHGHIRAGRTAQQKQMLLETLVTAVAESASTEKRYIWAYVSELPPSQMVEYGRILPEPGAEDQWLCSLPTPDRERLLSIGEEQPN
jgi:phenylpyruvate tautomerase PptA (4-oxalocrotonate tautomerase family)